jgi:manganese/iron transport system permease protein
VGVVDFFAAPLAYPFMVRGFAAAAIVAATCAVVGTYVVLRGMAFFGDALAHSILPGVAVGYLVHRGDRGPILLWALGTAVLAALGIGAVSRRGLKADTAIGIVFVGMFALGIALISTVRGYAVDLTHFLFGNVLAVSASDLWLTLGIGGAVVLIVVALYKEFLVVSFDPVFAGTLRMRTGLFSNLLLLLIAVTVVISLKVVGVVLVLAMLVTPAATAQLLTRRMGRMMVLAASLGALAGVVGLYISFYVGIASGPAIVLVATVLFVLVLLIAPKRGSFARRRQQPTTSPG